ncbi:MAG: hypothetical protein HKM00_12360 [Gallionella sp.]|nr:hypothetical protein [Gallionella sp.]
MSHIVALCVVWLTDISSPVKWLLLVMMLSSLGVYLVPVINSFRNPSGRSFSLEKNNIAVFDGDDVNWNGVVLPKTVVTPYFVLLCVKAQNQGTTRYQLICSDALCESEFRQLRMMLKLSQ